MTNFATLKPGDIFTIEGYFVKIPWWRFLVMAVRGERYVPKLQKLRALKICVAYIAYEEVKP